MDVFRCSFCISNAESLSYFYSRFVWPTDLESIPYYPHVLTTEMIISSKFKVDNWYDHPLPIYSVLAVDTLCDLVTLTVVIHGGSHDQPFNHVWRSYAYSLLSYESSLPLHTTDVVFTNIAQCTCAVVMWLVHRGKFYLLIWNPQPHFVYSLRNFGGPTMKVTRVIWQNNALPRCTSICTQATWPWPSDPEQLSHMVGHVNNFATKLEDPMPIHSWVEL